MRKFTLIPIVFTIFGHTLPAKADCTMSALCRYDKIVKDTISISVKAKSIQEVKSQFEEVSKSNIFTIVQPCKITSIVCEKY